MDPFNPFTGYFSEIPNYEVLWCAAPDKSSMVEKVLYVKDFHISKLAQFCIGVKQKIPEVVLKKPK